MQTLTKCILLPIDGTDEALRPAAFIRRLYPPSEVSLILSYFSPPPSSAYSGALGRSPESLKKEKQLLERRQQDTHRIFHHAREVLLKEGFSKELLQEHVQQRAMSVAKQACLLADIKKVDAVLVQKRVSSRLEDFIRGDVTSALLDHCLASPIWFTEGEIDPEKAAICIVNEDASLRIADHVAFMLAGTGAEIAVMGPTAGMVPEPMFRRGVRIVGGVSVKRPDELLNILAAGGSGYHLFDEIAMRIVWEREA